jgi:hypothetical protein
MAINWNFILYMLRKVWKFQKNINEGIDKIDKLLQKRRFLFFGNKSVNWHKVTEILERMDIIEKSEEGKLSNLIIELSKNEVLINKFFKKEETLLVKRISEQKELIEKLNGITNDMRSVPDEDRYNKFKKRYKKLKKIAKEISHDILNLEIQGTKMEKLL